MAYYGQMMRYFENLHYLNDLGVLDDQIWEANKSGIELFCSHQMANPAYPVLGEDQEFKYRAAFIQFWRSTCDLN